MGDNMKKKRTGLIVTVIILTLLLVFSAGRFVMKKKGIIPSSRTEAAGQKESSAQGGGRRPGFLKSAVSDTEEKETVFAVNTTPAVLGPIADYLKINGEILSASSVDVYADTQGILAELYVSLGDYVKKDRVIA
jgi:multidrug efflux pump subunit AcrA (membrane-fusion protein)